MKLEARSRLLASGSATKYFEPKLIEDLRVPAWKGRSKLISMHPQDFLSMAEHFDSGHPDERKLANLRKLIVAGTKLNQIPVLWFERTSISKMMRVHGHEGRHRAWILMHEQGCTSMPVEFRGPIRWSEQLDPKNFDYEESWPASLRGQTSGRIIFPVEREDSMKPFEG